MPADSSNSPPIALLGLPDQSATATESLRFTLPSETIYDPDGFETLTWSLTLADGSPLPAWLAFSPERLSMVGNPGADAAGVYGLLLVATDDAGQSAAAPFRLVINSATDPAPPAPPSLPPPIQPVDPVLQLAIDSLWPAGSKLTRPDASGSCGASVDSLSIAGLNRSTATYQGGAGRDTLLGTAGADVLRLEDPARPGHALLAGIEVLDMGEGDDVVDLTSARLAYGDVTILGGRGKDVLWAGAGNDVLRGGMGDDDLNGGAGNDLLCGDSGYDRLDGGAGNDVLQGGEGNDTLTDLSGTNLLDGGNGDDRITNGAGTALIAGGRGNDVIAPGSGRDVILFNRGDGDDVVTGAWEARANDVLSLGGGLAARDLVLSRSGNDLVVRFGAVANGSVRLDGWYAGNRSIQTLQVIGGTAEAPAVSEYDFERLAARFDAQPAAVRGAASGWSVAAVVEQVRLQASSQMAYGGMLASTYAAQGSFAGVNLEAAFNLLGSAGFGRDLQSVQTPAGTATGTGTSLAGATKLG